jgi:hypothetical protein
MGSRPDEIMLAGKKRSGTILEGVGVPMCNCVDRFKLVKSQLLGCRYGMGWFMTHRGLSDTKDTKLCMNPCLYFCCVS